MAGRIRSAASDRGLPARGVAGVIAALRAAAEPRLMGPHAPGSERHPDLLHPARTVLILLNDLGETDPRVLAVGALAESRRPELRVEEAVAEEILTGMDHAASPRTAYEWWRTLPLPVWLVAPSHEPDSDADSALLEALVVAPAPVQRVVLAEGLDLVRHAHLRDDRAERVRAVALAERVFSPIAPRVHQVLDRRFGWWMRRVGRTLQLR